MSDSTNTQPPDFGPTQPVYPPLAQLVRVTAPSIGGNVYPGLTQQFVPPLGIRDREACYVIEPNKIVLGPGIYDCRLVSNYLGLPLYATTCCPGGAFGSSSSSSAGPAAPGIVRVNRGSAFGAITSAAGLSIPSVSAAGGSLLVLCVGEVTSNATITATWNGLPFTLANSGNIPGAGPFIGTAYLFYLLVPSPATSSVSISLASGSATVLASVLQVTGLSDRAPDKSSSASGIFTIAATGPSGSIDFVNEYIEAMFLMVTPGTYSWLHGFTGGGQDVSTTVSGFTVTLADGYTVSDRVASFEGELSTSPVSWRGLLETFS